MTSSGAVHNNKCCLAGCDVNLATSAQFLKACASSEMADGGVTFKDPVIGPETDDEGNGFCTVKEVSGIVYLLGENAEDGTIAGTEACTLDSEITRSTQFPEDGVTNLHCCKAAFESAVDNDLYCQIDYEFSDPFDVNYDAENEVCTQTEGTSQKVYRD